MITNLGASSLPLDAVPRTRETKFVMRYRRTLDKVRVFQSLLAQRTLERSRVGGCRSGRSIGQRYGGGRYKRYGGRTGIHRCTWCAVWTNATGRSGRRVQGTSSGTGTVSGGNSGAVYPSTATRHSGASGTTAVGFTRCYRGGADVSTAWWSTSAGRTAYKTRLVKKKKQ